MYSITVFMKLNTTKHIKYNTIKNLNNNKNIFQINRTNKNE